ncbi:adenosine kinase [Methylopila jiangsuensis]|uniref:Adenosine kinase n=1 Tax=Methylopila jiangsuensis TaxID=586230 RepID=A0A9W6JK92_9HYPH|nr:adenosine kinase [Methylopila jiangsuensis]MDR6285205.1 sugar/nucleoside kinase (ribokinase family) [Methylopila jiangsuensis]GLK77405.1 adenosine kinase [Methylopila jiangsuensis]
MSDARYDVLGIGNAIVDVIARTEDDFLVAEGLVKGSMALIDEARAETLYARMGPAIEASGGSAANTVAGVSSFGGRAAFVGKVKDDAPGGVFAHDIRAIGVDFSARPAGDGAATARCFVLVTPDGERTMNTYLGACQALGPDDIDAEMVAAAKITYLEGYLWDPAEAKLAFRKAAEIAHGAGRKVALSLSDSFCVDRYRAEFLELVRSGTVDLLFANDSELKSLYETSDIEAALQAAAKDAKLAAITLGADGCAVIAGETRLAVAAAPVDGAIVDKTGAGDLFAAGFLLGHARGLDLTRSAELGGLAAAEVISHVGARPLVNLQQLATERGLL